MIRIDLRSKNITSSQNVFLVRPGSNYKLYDVFESNEGIFVDLPGLNLEHGLPLDQQDRITAQLHRARKLRAFRRSKEEPPSRNLDDYNNYKNDRSILQLSLILKGFFEEAKKGDLVVVPPSAFSQKALIGELLDDPTGIVSTTVIRGQEEETLYGRRVRWLASLPKGNLSPYLLDLISKPNAFVLIKADERYAIYRAAYGSYALPGEYRARFDVDDPEFTTSDDLYIQAFFNFVAVNSFLIRANQDVMEIRDAAFERSGANALELQSNINSPGFLNLISPTLVPLIATALFTLAISVGPEAVTAAEKDTILVGNSLDPSDPCTAVVHEEVLQHLRLLGTERWARACVIARQAQESTGISGQARIEIDKTNGAQQ